MTKYLYKTKHLSVLPSSLLAPWGDKESRSERVSNSRYPASTLLHHCIFLSTT